MSYFISLDHDNIILSKAESVCSAYLLHESPESRQTIKAITDINLIKACTILLNTTNVVIMNKDEFYQLNREGIKWIN